jgi:hypothetical protein
LHRAEPLPVATADALGDHACYGAATGVARDGRTARGDVPVVVTHFQTQQRDFGAERNRRAVAAQVRYIPEMTYNRPYDTTPRRTSNHVE